MRLKSPISLLLLVSSLAVALEAGEWVEFTEFVNGRGTRNFYGSANNVKFVVPPGTVGKVEKVRQLRSGNHGILVTLQNGSRKGERVWVYYNPKTPWLKLLAEGAEVKDPQDATHVKTTQNTDVLPASQSIDEQEKRAKAEASRIVTSKIDVATAISCSAALDRAYGVEVGYPPGTIAVAGVNAHKVSGAYLFDSKNARFFPNLSPMGQDEEFMEFHGHSEKDFAVPLEKGTVDLSDRSRAFVAQHIFRKMVGAYFSLYRAESASAAAPKSSAEPTEQELIAAVKKTARELTDVNVQQGAVAPPTGEQKPGAEPPQQVIEGAERSLQPSSQPPPTTNREKFEQALEICDRVKDEPAIPRLVRVIVQSSSRASEQRDGTKQGETPKQPQGAVEAQPAN